MATNIKEQIKNKLGDELRAIEMDVTSSFLNGKICSPLMTAASNTATSALTTASHVMNAASSTGLYITKDGLQYDPSALTNVAFSIVNTAIQSIGIELTEIRNRTWSELTYIPDPSIIVSKSITYFAYMVSNDEELTQEITNTFNKKAEDQIQEETDKKPSKAMKAITNFIDNKLPNITKKIGYVTDFVTTYSAYVSYYASFGPEWVSDQVAYYISEGSYIVSYYAHDLTTHVNDFKMQVYDSISYSMGKSMYSAYRNIMIRLMQRIQNTTNTTIKKGLITASAAIQKANVAIMSKTGTKIPIQIQSLTDLSKIKDLKKKADLISKIAGADAGGGAAETSPNPEDNTTENTQTVSEEQLVNGLFIPKTKKDYEGHIMIRLNLTADQDFVNMNEGEKFCCVRRNYDDDIYVWYDWFAYSNLDNDWIGCDIYYVLNNFETHFTNANSTVLTLPYPMGDLYDQFVIDKVIVVEHAAYDLDYYIYDVANLEWLQIYFNDEDELVVEDNYWDDNSSLSTTIL